VKFLVVGDPHIDTATPRSRKDDYCVAIWDKLREIKNLAIDNNVEAIIWLGDLFNKQDPSRVAHSLVYDLFQYFNNYPRNIRNLIALGNHDIRANADNWRKQPIGVIVAAGKSSGAIEPLWQDSTSENVYGKRIVCVGNVNIEGSLFSYEADIDKNRTEYYKLHRPKTDRFTLKVTHSALLPDDANFFADFTRVGELADRLSKEESPELYLCGHIHTPFGLFSSKHINVYNPGSISRGALDEQVLEHKPQVGLLTVEGGKWKVENIILKSAKPSEDIFKILEKKEQDIKDQQIAFLSGKLTSELLGGQFRAVNLSEAVETVLVSDNVKSEVKALVREFIEEAKGACQ
jgi:exonuclease SbcD